MLHTNKKGSPPLPYHINSPDKPRASDEPGGAHSILAVLQKRPSPQPGTHWNAQEAVKDRGLWITFSPPKNNAGFHLSRSSAKSHYEHSKRKRKSDVDHKEQFPADVNGPSRDIKKSSKTLIINSEFTVTILIMVHQAVLLRT